jgi:hypothetical protein
MVNLLVTEAVVDAYMIDRQRTLERERADAERADHLQQRIKGLA